MKEEASESLETCTFCLIANGADKEATILKKNKELVVFKDIYPAAPHHYLVVPIQHLTSFHSLQRRHVDLVERMAEMGKAVLHDQGITDMSDIRLGFHQPPYTSVDHLHLHVLAPARQISQFSAFKFIPESYRFVTVERLLRHLKQKPPGAPRSAGCLDC
ncbi:hypothetical protein fugu_017713 [Takifugu bimaculatus]|uniref:HIT domain-containing protein n=2 Tax=Takifugu TaxID=31032 RepID=A0A4Z2BRT2_9TELE|nr:hypothetical protein fugu_017713 [Takifugu bimaculatus]